MKGFTVTENQNQRRSRHCVVVESVFIFPGGTAASPVPTVQTVSVSSLFQPSALTRHKLLFSRKTRTRSVRTVTRIFLFTH